MADEPAGATVEVTKVPRRERITTAIAIVLFGVPMAAGATMSLLEKLQLPLAVIGTLAALSAVFVLWVAWKVATTKETVSVIPLPQTPEQIQADQEAARKAEEQLDRWWVRYPMAVGLFAVAAYVQSSYPDKWWIAGILALFGILAMREILFAIIALGAIWLVVMGLTSLPVSLAIIVGAVIIAYALSNRG